jgi:hypothetical protein
MEASFPLSQNRVWLDASSAVVAELQEQLLA